MNTWHAGEPSDGGTAPEPDGRPERDAERLPGAGSRGRPRRRLDLAALVIVVVALTAAPAGVFGYHAAHLRAPAGARVVEIVARAPEQGGFGPDHITLQAGEAVRLRISSPDVVHGFSIPGLGVDIDEIYPGKVVEVDIRPEGPGRFPFACTRWCSVDHWRMRGVIDVVGAPIQGGVTPDGVVATQRPPLYQRLGIDLDAMRHAAADVPSGRPSASAGARSAFALPLALSSADERRATTPADAFARLRADPSNSARTDGEIWDAVAWAWLKDLRPDELAAADERFARDCAACHGPDGSRDGPAGKNLPGLAKMDPSLPRGPADFTDAPQMLAASDALLEGKILRGGMGTGMPEFGSLYTEAELRSAVARIRLFTFDR